MGVSLLSTERELYSTIWTSVDAYGQHAPGQQYFPVFLSLVGTCRGTVLDAGCGSGKSGLSLQAAGFTVTLCDLTDDGVTDEAKPLPFHPACLWQDLSGLARGVSHPGRSTFDYVYCCDVLEHIPPQFTMLAIRNLLAVARAGLFLSVSVVPDTFGAWIGTSLHRTVQSFTWWRDSLAELGTVTDARDLHHNALFYVVPHGR